MRRGLLVILCLAAFSIAGCRQPAGGSGPQQAFYNLTHPQQFLANNQNPWSPGTTHPNGSLWGAGVNAQQQFFAGLNEQLKNLNQRLGQSDTDNQQLLTEVAGLKQKLQAAGEYNYQLKQQLAETVSQIQTVQNEKRYLEQQLAASQRTLPGNNPTNGSLAAGGTSPPTQLPQAPTLRSNNSLLQKVQVLQIPGLISRMDGEVIRVELATDALFTPGTYQIAANMSQSLQQIVAALQREFPRQVIGVEAHWDGTPVQPAGHSAQQLTATQAAVLFQELIRLGVAERQLFTMAMGNNRPRYPAGPSQSANRRLEIVIYPETIDGL